MTRLRPAAFGLRGSNQERFQRFVGPPDFSCAYCQEHPEAGGCWLWQGSATNAGYGSFRLSNPRRRMTAHRYAWTLKHGKEPGPGMKVLHKCDTPLCCNALHLFTGTDRANVVDQVNKGRSYGQRNPERFLASNNGVNFIPPGAADEIRATHGKTAHEMAREWGISRELVYKIRRGEL